MSMISAFPFSVSKKVYLIYGAPFSENTYVKEHMGRGNLVVSFDRIYMTTFKAIYLLLTFGLFIIALLSYIDKRK